MKSSPDDLVFIIFLHFHTDISKEKIVITVRSPVYSTRKLDRSRKQQKNSSCHQDFQQSRHES